MKTQKIRLGRLGLVFGAALFVIALCGGMVLVLSPVVQKAINSLLWKADPVFARQMGMDLLDYDLPPGYGEVKAAEIQDLRMVLIGPLQAETNTIKILIIDESLTIKNHDEWLEYQDVWANNIDGRRYHTSLTGESEMLVRGQPLRVSLREGSDDAGLPVRQALASLPGRSGDIVIIFFGPAASWDQTIVDAFLASVR